MKEAVIRMETAARPTTDRSASPRLLKGLLLAITLVALLATTVILCQQDIENPSYVYMILDETGMQIIDGRPDGDRTTGLLDIRAYNSSRDAQLLLVKGQQVQVADAQGATYLVTTRRETVDNLLRRSDVTVGDGEMVVVDTTGETPTVSVMAEYSQTRDVTVTTPYKTERVVNHMLAKGTEGAGGRSRHRHRDLQGHLPGRQAGLHRAGQHQRGQRRHRDRRVWHHGLLRGAI